MAGAGQGTLEGLGTGIEVNASISLPSHQNQPHKANGGEAFLRSPSGSLGSLGCTGEDVDAL
jgi:hypothetical protein